MKKCVYYDCHENGVEIKQKAFDILPYFSIFFIKKQPEILFQAA